MPNYDDLYREASGPISSGGVEVPDSHPLLARGLRGIGSFTFDYSINEPPETAAGERIGEAIRFFEHYEPRTQEWTSVTVQPQRVPHPDNHGFADSFSESHAVVVVHPGFTERVARMAASAFQAMREQPDERYIIRNGDDELYGELVERLASKEFGAYSVGMERFNQAVQRAPANSLFFIEDILLTEAEAPGDVQEMPSDFAPPDTARVVATNLSDSGIAKTVRTAGGVLQQDRSVLFDGLRDGGVTTVFLGGELSHAEGSEGCLGGVALQFVAHGFEVRGIEEALYPAHPPTDAERYGQRAEGFDVDMLDMYRSLFGRAVSMHELFDAPRTS